MPEFSVDEVLRATGGTLLQGEAGSVLRGVSTDTRQLVAGNLYIPLKGERFDGHDFLVEAIARGAAGMLVDVRHAGGLETLSNKIANCLAILVEDTLRALGDLAHFWPALFAFAKTVNSRAGKMSVDEAALVAEQLLVCDRVLGYLDHARLPLAEKSWPREAADLVGRREEARKAKDFVRADALRVELAEMGLRLEDHPAGVRLFRRT